MRAPKLSAAQRDLLDDLPTPCAQSYPPAVKLVALGLAHWQPQRLTQDVLARGPAPEKDTIHD